MATGTGTVISFKLRADKPAFGFIRPDDGPCGSDYNLYFHERALEGAQIRVGDRVKYTLSPEPRELESRPGTVRSYAMRVDIIPDDYKEITTTAFNSGDRP
jgi:cold shock CspA family protein